MKNMENKSNQELNKEEIDNEMIYKFQMMEQQIISIQQQLNSIEQALVDMQSLKIGLNDIKKDKEILAPIGKGIFTEEKLISEKLTIDIGGKNYVKKNIKDTQDLIDEQIKKLEGVKEDLNKELEKINQEITNVMVEHQNKKNSN